MKKDEFLGTSEIKIISNIYRKSIERIVIVEGEETYRDYHVFPCTFSDEDPIRILQMFLFGEKPQNRTDRCCDTCNLISPIKKSRVFQFREFFKLITEFLKIRFKKFLCRLKASMQE